MSATTAGGTPTHHEDVDTIGRRWRMGVGFLIVADASFVAATLFSYRYLRGLNTEGAWLPHGTATATIWVSWVLAAGLLLSAALFGWGERGIRGGDKSRLVVASAAGVFVLVLVGVGQVIQIAGFAFAMADSAYTSSMYLLTGANLFHIVLTLFLGIAILNRARLNKYSAASNWQVGIVLIWWTWVAVAALISAFTTSYIASPLSGG